MANGNDVFASLSGLGFETEGNYCFGTWKNYAALLQKSAGKNLVAVLSVQIQDSFGTKRRELIRALKEKGLKSVKVGALSKTTASFALSYGKADNLPGFFTEALNAMTASLRESGIVPADTCALTGAARPDSLCLVPMNGVISYRPVCAASIREKETRTREQVEDNQANGSYALGFLGALLGMLVGLIPNVLGIIYTERIYGILFALVPLAAMFGYKLFKGKMSKGSIVIVVVLSLLGVVLIPWLEMVFYLVRDYGATLGEGVSYAAQLMLRPDFLSEMGAELLQLLLFMALGIWIAWKYVNGQTNSSQVSGTKIQLATLRPNPNAAQTEEQREYR